MSASTRIGFAPDPLPLHQTMEGEELTRLRAQLAEAREVVQEYIEACDTDLGTADDPTGWDRVVRAMNALRAWLKQTEGV